MSYIETIPLLLTHIPCSRRGTCTRANRTPSSHLCATCAWMDLVPVRLVRIPCCSRRCCSHSLFRVFSNFAAQRLPAVSLRKCWSQVHIALHALRRHAPCCCMRCVACLLRRLLKAAGSSPGCICKRATAETILCCSRLIHSNRFGVRGIVAVR